VEIYLLRHGCTSSPGTYNGRTDVSLSEEGRNQVRALQPFISTMRFDRCYCSPLSRCQNTFELLDFDSPCSIESDLLEIDFGRWEGLTFTEIEKRFPDQLERWARQQERFTFPDGEMITAFNSRVCRWFDKLLTKDYERVFIVSHGGVLRTGICHLLGFDSAQAFAFHVKEGHLSTVNVSDGFGRLDLFNWCVQ